MSYQNEISTRFNKTTIAQLAYLKGGSAQQIFWDDQLPGFGVRVYPSGKKSYVIKYRLHGVQHQLTISSVELLSVDEARARAKRHFVQIMDKEDPLAAKRKTAVLFSELAKMYLERHCPTKKSASDDIHRINYYLLPVWKNRPVQSITRAEISTLHAKIGAMRDNGGKRGGRTVANRVREILHTMYERGKEWGLIEEALANPAKRITDFKETKRSRFLTAEEVQRLSVAISDEPSIHIQCALWLYLLTGLRKRELLQVKWSDVDLNAKTLRAPTKNGTIAYQPLSTAAIDVLARIPRKVDNPYVFPGWRKGRHLVNIRNPWVRIRASAGIEDVTIHDLRRTVGAWLAQSGCSLLLIGKVLNQTTEQATAVYAILVNRDAEKALEQHGEQMRKYM